jgi:hypothetical protein
MNYIIYAFRWIIILQIFVESLLISSGFLFLILFNGNDYFFFSNVCLLLPQVCIYIRLYWQSNTELDSVRCRRLNKRDHIFVIYYLTWFSNLFVKCTRQTHRCVRICIRTATWLSGFCFKSRINFLLCFFRNSHMNDSFEIMI